MIYTIVLFAKYTIIKIVQCYYWLIYLYNVHINRVEPASHKPTFAQTQLEQFNKSMNKYQEFYANASDDDNANIDLILYNYDERKSIFQDPNNFYEKQWKSRALYESTPRGNVLMYYNPYTLSFSYHSDEQIIPYTILQMLASKYVVMYRCKDFYIDPTSRPANKLFELLQKEENALISNKTKVQDITKVNIQSSNSDIYASLKDYKMPVTSTNQKPVKPLPNANFSNKFVRIGKVAEFNILASPPCKKVQATNELLFGTTPVSKMNDFFDDLDIVENPFSTEESDTSASVSSYAMFKKLKTSVK